MTYGTWTQINGTEPFGFDGFGVQDAQDSKDLLDNIPLPFRLLPVENDCKYSSYLNGRILYWQTT